MESKHSMEAAEVLPLLPMDIHRPQVLQRSTCLPSVQLQGASRRPTETAATLVLVVGVRVSPSAVISSMGVVVPRAAQRGPSSAIRLARRLRTSLPGRRDRTRAFMAHAPRRLNLIHRGPTAGPLRRNRTHLLRMSHERCHRAAIATITVKATIPLALARPLTRLG